MGPMAGGRGGAGNARGSRLQLVGPGVVAAPRPVPDSRADGSGEAAARGLHLRARVGRELWDQRFSEMPCSTSSTKSAF